jgi:adenylate cyclase
MGREIERKFLLRDDAWRAGIERSVHMAQGYLGEVSRASVRVRIADRDATINIKSAHPGISRDEFEYAIPLADAEALLTLCSGWPVIKTRHIVRVGAHTWEIDEFAGANAGLIVAEIELDAPDEEFERPPWLGEEVSEDWRYYNVALAREPFSEWGR